MDHANYHHHVTFGDPTAPPSGGLSTTMTDMAAVG